MILIELYSFIGEIPIYTRNFHISTLKMPIDDKFYFGYLRIIKTHIFMKTINKQFKTNKVWF